MDLWSWWMIFHFFSLLLFSCCWKWKCWFSIIWIDWFCSTDSCLLILLIIRLKWFNKNLRARRRNGKKTNLQLSDFLQIWSGFRFDFGSISPYLLSFIYSLRLIAVEAQFIADYSSFMIITCPWFVIDSWLSVVDSQSLSRNRPFWNSVSADLLLDLLSEWSSSFPFNAWDWIESLLSAPMALNCRIAETPIARLAYHFLFGIN